MTSMENSKYKLGSNFGVNWKIKLMWCESPAKVTFQKNFSIKHNKSLKISVSIETHWSEAKGVTFAFSKARKVEKEMLISLERIYLLTWNFQRFLITTFVNILSWQNVEKLFISNFNIWFELGKRLFKEKKFYSPLDLIK